MRWSHERYRRFYIRTRRMQMEGKYYAELARRFKEEGVSTIQ